MVILRKLILKHWSILYKVSNWRNSGNGAMAAGMAKGVDNQGMMLPSLIKNCMILLIKLAWMFRERLILGINSVRLLYFADMI